MGGAEEAPFALMFAFEVWAEEFADRWVSSAMRVISSTPFWRVGEEGCVEGGVVTGDCRGVDFAEVGICVDGSPV